MWRTLASKPIRRRPHRNDAGVRAFLAAGLVAGPAAATTVLTVDLSSTIRPVTHAASGSLYGVTEKLPADANALIAPTHPSVFNNPAADVQQPVGDAIVVAGRVASLGGRVSIRLADWFPGWPYSFTNMNDWLDKVGQTVARKKASGLDNYYGYEIWNEPNGTWTSSMAFTDFWKQTYAKLRDLDPGAKAIGPSIASYDGNYLKNFLSFAKTNDCLPDIVSWHELSGANITANFQNYRALEKQLGIGPLPISINEYSGKNRIDDEGRPGASAPLIAKFERFEVDSACISYWDVPHPGRLGTLLASDTARNGGWWFYKWYGDMTGNMVATTPPSANDPAALDGFANLDAAAGKASVLFGGVNDGAVQVVVKGFHGAPLFGSTVHAVAERTPFVNRSTTVNATDTLSTMDLTVANDQITVSFGNTNGSDGYRLSLTGMGSSGMGGAGTGGSSGSGGASGGGATAAGGAIVSGTAGTPGGSGGGSGLGIGGVVSGNGGATLGTGGATSRGGNPGSGGGAGTPGAPSSGAGGNPVDVNGAAGAAATNGPDARNAGCNCGVPRDDSDDREWGMVMLVAFATWSRQRTRYRRLPALRAARS